MPAMIEYPLNSVVERHICLICRRSMSWEIRYSTAGTQYAAAGCCGHTHVFADHDFQSRQNYYWELQVQTSNQIRNRQKKKSYKALGWSFVALSGFVAAVFAVYGLSQ